MNENVTKTKEQDGRKPGEDYRDADGILVCGKCGEPRERMFPAGGIFKEPAPCPDHVPLPEGGSGQAARGSRAGGEKAQDGTAKEAVLPLIRQIRLLHLRCR